MKHISKSKYDRQLLQLNVQQIVWKYFCTGHYFNQILLRYCTLYLFVNKRSRFRGLNKSTSYPARPSSESSAPE